MAVKTAIHTDTGTVKNVNQDSISIQVATCNLGTLCLGVICDGMGGLKKGELASATVIRGFTEWFSNRLPELLTEAFHMEMVKQDWNGLTTSLNNKISSYGKTNGVALGTTLTGVLLLNDRYLCINIGDTRLYKIGQNLDQITKDQTLVAREIALGRLTPEQAKHDRRRNVLLQCIGASERMKPEYFEGNLQAGERLLLCSDGFRHEISGEEIFNAVAKTGDEGMEPALKTLIETNKARGEKDNITAAVISFLG